MSAGSLASKKTKKTKKTVTYVLLGAVAAFVLYYAVVFAIAAAVADNGLLFYGQTGNFAAKWRLYDNESNAFSPPVLTKPGSAVPVNFVVKTAPEKTEAVAGYANASGVLQVACYDGAVWSNDWTATVGGRGKTRKFDIAYETSSGNVMALYAADSTAGQVLYRIKSGSAPCGEENWSAPISFEPKNAAGVEWIKLASDPRANSNLLTAVWADDQSHLSSMVWSGSSWGNEPAAHLEKSLQVFKSGQDVDDFAVAYESISGNVKVVWGSSEGKNGKNGVREANCAGGTAQCAWSAVTAPPTWSDDATNLSLVPNPRSNEMVFASIGKTGSDLQVGYWSGVKWTNSANIDITSGTPKPGTQLVAAVWVGNRSIIAYGNGGDTGVDWVVGNKGKFEIQKNKLPLAGTQYSLKRLAFINNPTTDRTLLLLADNNDYLFAKKLTSSLTGFSWTNIEDTSQAQLGKNIPFPTADSFAFAFWPGVQKNIAQHAAPDEVPSDTPLVWVFVSIIIFAAGGLWLGIRHGKQRN